MTWFERLTGCSEDSPESVRQHLQVDGRRLHSLANNKSWQCGHLETPSLGQLREQVSQIQRAPQAVSLHEVVGNVQHLHQDPNCEHALFQVASQFNLLEMTSPSDTPERGVGIYEQDFTQGPACAIAAGAGTIYRNYFVNVNGQVGQTANNQIDCLSDIATLLNNTQQQHWEMVNGYALPTAEGLKHVSHQLKNMSPVERDEVRQALRIGLQWDTQVTLENASHTVSQAYCSAMPVAYTQHSPQLWQPLATLVLEAAYEATFCAAIQNKDRTGCNQVFLTLLGGGAFGNSPDWIINSIRRSLQQYSDSGLNIAIVSYGSSNRSVQQLIQEFT